MPQISKEQFESKKLTEEQVRQSLQFAIWRLESQFTWNNDTVSQTLMDLATKWKLNFVTLCQHSLLRLRVQRVQRL